MFLLWCCCKYESTREKQMERFMNKLIFVDNVILHTVYWRWQREREIASHNPRVCFIECVDIKLFIWRKKKNAETNDRNLLLEAGSGGRIGRVLMTETQIIDFSHLCKESISIEMALREKQRRRRWWRRKRASQSCYHEWDKKKKGREMESQKER